MTVDIRCPNKKDEKLHEYEEVVGFELYPLQTLHKGHHEEIIIVILYRRSALNLGLLNRSCRLSVAYYPQLPG